MKYVALVIFTMALCGCQGPLGRYYEPVDPGCETVATTPVRIYRTSLECIGTKGDGNPQPRDPNSQTLTEQGYVRIGNSSFETWEYINTDMIIAFAEKIGAGAVVYYSWEPVTTTYRTVIPIYNQGQTYQSNYSGVGPGGYYSGTVTTTGPSSISVMPVQGSETTQEWVIAYFAKKKY
jgi:hypothetical protein